MDKNAVWKWLVLAVMVFGSLALVTPVRERVQLGLDLSGGSSFVVELDADALRERIRQTEGDLEPSELDRRVRVEMREGREVALEAIRNRVDGLGIAEPQIFTQMDDRIVIQMPGIDAEKRAEARETILSVAFLEFRLVHTMSDRWVERLRADERAPRGYRWVPGTRFLVADYQAVPREERDREFRRTLRRFAPREGAEFMLQEERLEDRSTAYRAYYIETTPQLTGEAVSFARVDYDQMGRPKIALEFNRMGRRRFAQVTRDYAPRGERNRDSEDGRLLAIILDGTLYSAPEIRSEIATGRAEITGRFSVQEATRLVNVLRTGRLPVPVRIVEERTVDPSLGQDAIRSGAWASVYGGVAVVLFMLLYYQTAGVIANLSLVLVLIMLPLGMVIVSGFMGVLTRTGGGGAGTLPTLTLPGIAGIVLTLGMAVDANVLIFERIREELKTGKRLVAAIGAGYDKAFSTIMDSNTTTLLAALIMFWQGSGPVRGYAVTLSAGIMVSMFTAVVVTRLFFNLLVQKTSVRTLPMMEWVKETKIDFVGKRKVALAISAVAIVVTAGLFLQRGSANFGVDFLGGSEFTIEVRGPAESRVSVGDLRAALGEAGIGDAAMQYQSALGATAEEGGRETLTIRVPFEQGAQAREALENILPAAHYRVVQQDEVGPQMGDELKRRGMMALIWSMVGIIIYIAWRFEFSFAIGSIAAVLHDAVLAIGIFTLLGRQLSMPMIAAVLTIIGYSVNDTIVVFDRIREDLKLMRGRPYSQIANISINQTLSRTLLTSGTTLLCVLSLLVFGGGAIFDFALMLLIGVLVGTYSSIFIATPVVLLWHPDAKRKSAQG